MSGRFDWERAIRALPLRPPVRKLVALTLATYADKDGTNAHPGEDRLAEDCGITTRAVRGHLSALRELGLIVRTFRGSSYGRSKAADEYHLAMPPDVLSRLDHRNHGAGADQENTGTTVPVFQGEPPEPQRQNTGTSVQNTGTSASGTPERGFRPPDQDQGRDQPRPQPHPLPASSPARARDESAAMGEGDRKLGARPHAYRPDSSNVACETCELPENHPRHQEAS